jgi:glycyl-tRNA synthetase
MLEICATCVTPEVVLKASGHVDRFADLLITDVKTNQGYRADKVVKDFLEHKLAKDALSVEAK